METIVINREKEGKNIPKFKYKFNSSEAIALYAAIYIILFLICKLIYFILASTKNHSINSYFDIWYPVIIPFISIIVFTILFSTKLVLKNRIDFYKKYVIFAETITIYRMWYGTYSILGIKNSIQEYMDDDIVAIIFIVLQLIVMAIGLLILRYRTKDFRESYDE